MNFSHSLGHKSVEVFALNQPSSSPICNHTVYLPGLQLLNLTPCDAIIKALIFCQKLQCKNKKESILILDDYESSFPRFRPRLGTVWYNIVWKWFKLCQDICFAVKLE